MLSTLVLLAAAVAPFPEAFDLDETRLEVELTCHFQTSRFEFSGRDGIVIEDLGENGAVVDRHVLPDDGRLGRTVTMLLEGGFAQAPSVVEGWHGVPDDEGRVERFTVEIDGGCRAAVAIEIDAFSKRTEYRDDAVIPDGLAEYLRSMHFEVATGSVRTPSDEG